MIFFTAARIETRCAHPPREKEETASPAISETAQTLQDLQDQKSIADAKANVARAEAELARITKTLNPDTAEKKSRYEQLKEQVEAELELDLAEEELRKHIETKYADKPELKERRLKALEKKIRDGLV